MEPWIVVLGSVAGLYMAWNIGANDVANGMAAAVGAKAITLRQAVLIAGGLDFIGAAFIGSHVTNTIRKNIVDPSILSDTNVLSIGLLAVLLAASFWVFFATWRELPVSTTHSVVGAMIGFGLITGGLPVIKWGRVLAIVASWIISPFFASLLSFFMFWVIRSRILSAEYPFLKALRWSPLFVGINVFIIALSLLVRTPLGSRLELGFRAALLLALALAAALGGLGRILMQNTIVQRGEEGVEEIFRWLQVLTACYVALAHGANDVANAVGPLAGIYIIHTTNAVSPEVPVPSYLLAVGGLAIAVGVVTWGYRVIETVGMKITHLTNTSGFSVAFATATCVLVASKLGLPVSTTHAAVGAVVGVGLSKGMEAVNFSVVWKIFFYWIATLPVAAISCIVFFLLLGAMLP